MDNSIKLREHPVIKEESGPWNQNILGELSIRKQQLKIAVAVLTKYADPYLPGSAFPACNALREINEIDPNPVYDQRTPVFY